MEISKKQEHQMEAKTILFKLMFLKIEYLKLFGWNLIIRRENEKNHLTTFFDFIVLSVI